MTGARPSGLGGAFVGLADSGDAVFSNPAGLGQITRPEIMGTYSKLYIGLEDDSELSNGNLSLTYPFSNSEKFGVVSFGSSMFTLQNYYTETSIGVYYGKKMSKLMCLGMGVKQLKVSYGEDKYTLINPVFDNGYSKTGIAMDAGILIFPLKQWSFGMSVINLNSPDLGIKYSDKVPMTISVGSAYRHNSLNIVSDVNSQNGNMKFLFGGEKWFFSRQLAVRLAFGFGSKKYSRFNAGCGYEGENIGIDYSFFYPLSGLSGTLGTHKVTLGYKFGYAPKTNVLEARKLYKAGVRKIEGGDFTGALSNVQQAGELDSVNKKYNEMKNRLEVVTEYIPQIKGEGKPEEAIRKGVAKYSDEGDVKESMSMLMYASSLMPDNEELVRLIKTIAKRNNMVVPDMAKSWNLAEQKVFQALGKFKNKKYDECIKLCEEALVLEPNNVTAHKRLGSTFYMLGKIEKAKYHWQKVVEIAPDDAEIPEIKRMLMEIEIK